MTSTLIHRHRRAGHQRPRPRRPARHRRGRRARRRGRHRRLGRAARSRHPPADEAYDAGGRAVIPGFVDSHSHLVFAGDRAAEFAARMAGEPYAAGGIRTTVAATRAATDEQLTSHVARLVARDAPAGHDHRRDQERLRPDDEGRGPQPRGRPPVHRRDHVPRRPRRPRRHRPGGVRRPGHRADAGGRALRTPAGSTSFCERGAFDGDQAAPDPRGRAGRRAAGPAARQPARARAGRPAGRRARPAAPSTTAPTSRTPTSTRCATPAPSPRCCPGVEFSTRQPYPDARRLLDAGVRVALASDCNPGSLLHQLDPAVHRAGGPGDGDDPGRGGVRRHAAGRRRARPRRRRRAGRRAGGPT